MTLKTKRPGQELAPSCRAGTPENPRERNRMDTETNTTRAVEAASERRYSGPGLYKLSGYNGPSVVFLDPLPEPQRTNLGDDEDWLMLSETKEMRRDQGNWWVRAGIIEPMIVRKVRAVPAVSDTERKRRAS
ncbi:hypothetical protein [Jiella sonneratiae]|uniref:Uncharacterized protein n=1 Tax=Jiella sonneratiae TaxID=2816856 RepID=A0ABS3J7B3_9HYPH|nr:hypothetical protein [Jiella sonneratiae]MBO0905571.1 hypothetical protein [Jiella sonneratiae]